MDLELFLWCIDFPSSLSSAWFGRTLPWTTKPIEMHSKRWSHLKSPSCPYCLKVTILYLVYCVWFCVPEKYPSTVKGNWKGFSVFIFKVILTFRPNSLGLGLFYKCSMISEIPQKPNWTGADSKAFSLGSSNLALDTFVVVFYSASKPSYFLWVYISLNSAKNKAAIKSPNGNQSCSAFVININLI